MNSSDDPLLWSPDFADRSVTRERVESIAFTPMPVRLRNELVTQGYGDLAEAMAAVVGYDNATWATFGQWASGTIGNYLTFPVPVLGRVIARAFGDGNRDVFADVGRGYAAFLATVGEAHQAGTDLDQAWTACERELRRAMVAPPGRPGAGAAESWEEIFDPRRGGDPSSRNILLVLGFRAYRDSLSIDDPEAKARAILLGNVLLAYHEQRLLALAVSMGFRTWLRTITTLWRPLQTTRSWRERPPGRVRIRLEESWIRFATKRIISVHTPSGKVRVGKPVPPGPNPVVVEASKRGRELDVRTPPQMSSDQLLSHLWRDLDVRGDGVDCWNDLGQRVAYIAELFAQFQRSDEWYDGPNSVRPEAWPKFRAEIKRLERRLERTHPVARPEHNPEATECHMSDAELDRLRGLATAPVDVDLDALHFHSYAEEELTPEEKAIDADTAERLRAITGQDGLLDIETCRKARKVFGKWTTAMFIGLLCRSLPETYAAARGVRVLGSVSDLATDPYRRAGETAHFLHDILLSKDGWDDNALHEDSDGFISIQGVRRLHASGAAELMRAGWDTATYGVPMNQEDTIGAALSFAVPPIEMMADLGIQLGKGARNRYVRFWCGIGHLLGAPIEAFTVPVGGGGADGDRRRPINFDEAQALAAKIRMRHHVRSLDGVRLTEALVEGVADGFPRSFDWLGPGLMAVAGDRNVTGLLMVGAGRGGRRSELVASTLRFFLRRKITRRPTRLMIQAAGRIWLRPFFEEGSGRPYRRALNEAEIESLEAEIPTEDLWPVGCAGVRERRSGTEVVQSRMLGLHRFLEPRRGRKVDSQ